MRKGYLIPWDCSLIENCKLNSQVFAHEKAVSVCDFQSMKSLVELNSLLSKFFCHITWLLYHLIRRDTGRLAIETFTSNHIVSSKQKLNGLKITNWYDEMLPLLSVILAEAIRTTIRPEFRVPTDLFLLFAHANSTKIYSPLSFNLSFLHDHSTIH